MISTRRILSALLAGALLTACGGQAGGGGNGTTDAGPEAAGDPVAGGTLDVGLEAAWQSLDPLRMTRATSNRNIAFAIYAPLIQVDENGEFQPGLATGWETTDGGRTYVVTLREGVTFQDGTPFDAQAVKSHFDRIGDPANACTCLADLELIESVEATGPLEVTFTLTQPSAILPALLVDTPGLIPSPAAVAAPGGLEQNPVGAGPFQFVQATPGDSVQVERFEDYWQEGQPYLDQITFRVIPDPQARFSALQAGDIDIQTVPVARNVVEAQRAGDLQLVDMGALGTVYVMTQTQRPPFDDPRARRALALASDMPAINQSLLQGTTEHVQSPIPDDVPLAPEQPENYPEYDLEQAKQLVGEIGGLDFTLTIQNQGPTLELAQALQSMWAEAGINAEIAQVEQTQLVTEAFKGNFQAMIFRHGGGWDPDQNTYRFFHSQGGPSNYVRLNDPELDALLEAGRTELDPAKRTEIYDRVNQMLAELMPYNFIYAQNWRVITGPDVHGVPAIADGVLRSGQIWVEQ